MTVSWYSGRVSLCPPPPPTPSFPKLDEQGFQKDFEKYGASNAQIVGVSVDTIEKVKLRSIEKQHRLFGDLT